MISTIYANRMSNLEREFKIQHSEIMENFQCIEYDLKRIYSAMSYDDFDDEMDMLEKSNMGNTIKRLKELDYSDDDHFLSDSDYDQLDKIRELRNYWCHQCYLDFVYIEDANEKYNKLQRLFNRLQNENRRIEKLQYKIENMYLKHFVD